MDDRAGQSHDAFNWVDFKRGVVKREAFTSSAVYERELTHIFNRCWIFLAHESEIPNPGDFVTRNLGDAPVVVVRSKNNNLHAFVNSCRHRGTQLCRVESGSVKRFVCPYHGWTYEHDGRLVTTGFDSYLPQDTDFTSWGLAPVSRLETYKGLIFGSWNLNGESLEEHLGDFRFYLDAFFARTPKGMEVLDLPQRWRVKTNWKVGALNFLGDSQHVQTTHVGPLTLDPVRAAKSGLTRRSEDSVQVVVDGRHGCNLNYLASGLADSAYRTRPGELLPLYEQVLAPSQNKVLHNLRAGVGTVFPNLSFIESQVAECEKAVILRIWHPISPVETEIRSWVLAEKEASEAYKKSVLAKAMHNFGVAGVFEQDDIELWQSATLGSMSSVLAGFPYSFLSAVPFREKPLKQFHGPGRAYKETVAEIGQLEFMRMWEEALKSQL